MISVALLFWWPAAASLAQEPIIPSPLDPEEAAATMMVPEGFQATLFAGEPDVQQPIGFCIDDRGRLWVAEAFNYPERGGAARDRIIILEDVDGDGRHDRRTVFFEGLEYVTGIEVGFGGAWVMSPPNFYFIPDRDADDRPDTSPQVLLDGFGNHANAHNIANGFAWGPDGWLYGTHGRTNWSKIGRPGATEDERTVFDGGVYRYHPVRHVWEPYADGTTNPWGIDWNDSGDAFVCNCVNPHAFQVIPGAHYEPWRNRKSSEFAFERIPTIADHLHFTGGSDTRRGLGTSEEDAAGGGHAHCGTMIYLGDNWPDRFRNGLFMNNIHGRRINHDMLTRRGSGYTASHGADVMRSADPWFMGVTLRYGPDGSVFVSDWSDTGECHSIRNTQRQTGRIYRLRYAQPVADRPQRPAPSAASNAQLVAMHLERNDWWVRSARRNLQERSAAGDRMPDVISGLIQMLQRHPDVTRRLRALWTLHAIGAAAKDRLLSLLSDDQEDLRRWAVRLLSESRDPSAAALTEFLRMAKSDPSAAVRLELAASLQRIPIESRLPLAQALAAHGEDVADANIPLMLWYGIEPLVHGDPEEYVALAVETRIPLIRRHIARRVALKSVTGPGMDGLVQALISCGSDDSRIDMLTGLLEGLEGYRSVPLPAGWEAVRKLLRPGTDPRLRSLVTRASLKFNDAEAVRQLTRQALDATIATGDRLTAMDALVGHGASGFDDVLLTLLQDPATQTAAARGLAAYSHPQTVSALLSRYQSMSPEAKQNAVQTLASRSDWARQLLDAMESGLVARGDVTAYAARQIASLGDPALVKRLGSLWGNVRVTSADRVRMINRYKRDLDPASLTAASTDNGHLLFKKHCANCHRFFGEGGKIGPDITGAQRTNMDYMLENLIDPSASVARDYQMEVIQTTNGRVITGLIESENSQSVTLLTVNDRLVIPQSEIEERQTSALSMMPEGLLEPMTIEEIRDLMAYLSGSRPPTFSAE